MVRNHVGGLSVVSAQGAVFDKVDPATGLVAYQCQSSTPADVDLAVAQARRAFQVWAQTSPVVRGELLMAFASDLQENRTALGASVSADTGKSMKDALGEVDGAIACLRFFAGEGQRLYGRVATSRNDRRMPVIVREPLGIAALIVPANTPIANVLWKISPALICGNAVVLKSSEDAPRVAEHVAEIFYRQSFPSGVLNVVHGEGSLAGEALAANPDINVLSFTGSTAVGRKLAANLGPRLVRHSLELGGKNALVVFDDADLGRAVEWALSSAFSNAGQRCASASRIIVQEGIYREFRDHLLERIGELTLGSGDTDFCGPLISLRQLEKVDAAVQAAVGSGVKVLCGGRRSNLPHLQAGFYYEPTLIEGARTDSQIWREELFGPVALLLLFQTEAEAISLANDSVYGLTAAVHTTQLARAMSFASSVNSGVVNINGGTHGSEPHMPFGGRLGSGNGTREPGVDALDIYSQQKTISINY